eukprot:6172159-Pleurochrysis_carterae.AAC.1
MCSKVIVSMQGHITVAACCLVALGSWAHVVVNQRVSNTALQAVAASDWPWRDAHGVRLDIMLPEDG